MFENIVNLYVYLWGKMATTEWGILIVSSLLLIFILNIWWTYIHARIH